MDACTLVANVYTLSCQCMYIYIPNVYDLVAKKRVAVFGPEHHLNGEESGQLLIFWGIFCF